jgi:ribosomal protein S4E
MYFDVKEARYAGKYQIQLQFEDGSSGVVDFMKFMEDSTVLAKLKDPAVFKNFTIEYGTIVWKSHSLDIAPETLYAEATGKEVVFKSKSNVLH